jgi:hypothetical protein
VQIMNKFTVTFPILVATWYTYNVCVGMYLGTIVHFAGNSCTHAPCSPHSLFIALCETWIALMWMYSWTLSFIFHGYKILGAVLRLPICWHVGRHSIFFNEGLYM